MDLHEYAQDAPQAGDKGSVWNDDPIKKPLSSSTSASTTNTSSSTTPISRSSTKSYIKPGSRGDRDRSQEREDHQQQRRRQQQQHHHNQQQQDTEDNRFSIATTLVDRSSRSSYDTFVSGRIRRDDGGRHGGDGKTIDDEDDEDGDLPPTPTQPPSRGLPAVPPLKLHKDEGYRSSRISTQDLRTGHEDNVSLPEDSFLADQKPLTFLSKDDICIKEPFRIYTNISKALPRRQNDLVAAQRTLGEADANLQDLQSQLEKARLKHTSGALGSIRTQIKSATDQRDNSLQRVNSIRAEIASAEYRLRAMEIILIKFGWQISESTGQAKLKPFSDSRRTSRGERLESSDGQDSQQLLQVGEDVKGRDMRRVKSSVVMRDASGRQSLSNKPLPQIERASVSGDFLQDISLLGGLETRPTTSSDYDVASVDRTRRSSRSSDSRVYTPTGSTKSQDTGSPDLSATIDATAKLQISEATAVCEGCKHRNEKCDGRKPNCTLCVKHGNLCTYREPSVEPLKEEGSGAGARKSFPASTPEQETTPSSAAQQQLIPSAAAPPVRLVLWQGQEVLGVFSPENHPGLRTHASRQPSGNGSGAGSAGRNQLGLQQYGNGRNTGRVTKSNQQSGGNQSGAEPTNAKLKHRRGTRACDLSKRVACPFAKHDRGRYETVYNSCTERPGIESKRLTEHIHRVHSAKTRNGCIWCPTRWTDPNNWAEEMENHECFVRDDPAQLMSNPECMSAEQEEAIRKLDTSSRDTPEQRWILVYTSLFPHQFPIPDPRYDYLTMTHQIPFYTSPSSSSSSRSYASPQMPRYTSPGMYESSGTSGSEIDINTMSAFEEATAGYGVPITTFPTSQPSMSTAVSGPSDMAFTNMGFGAVSANPFATATGFMGNDQLHFDPSAFSHMNNLWQDGVGGGQQLQSQLPHSH